MRQAIGRKLTMGASVAVLVLGAAVHDASAQGKPATPAKPPTPASTATTPAPAKPTAPTSGTPTKPGTTAAGGTAQDAKAHYQAGEAKFKAGDFAGALPEFVAADAVKTTPQAQRYIGLCHDNLGHYPDAITAYNNFLANVPPKLAKEGEEIKKRVEVIKAMPGKLHLETSPPGATVTIDGKPSGVTPTDVDVAPGKHAVHFDLTGYLGADKDADVTFGSKQDVKSDLTAKPVEAPPPAPPPPVAQNTAPPPPPTPAPEPPKPHSMVPAIVTGSLAIVAAGVGAVFGIMALGDKSTYDTTPTADTADSGENKALIADMAFGVAITLGVTSAVLFFSKDDDAPAKPAAAFPPAPGKRATVAHKSKPFSITPTPIVTPHGGGAGALFRF